jgi:hypothetical protein
MIRDGFASVRYPPMFCQNYEFATHTLLCFAIKACASRSENSVGLDVGLDKTPTLSILRFTLTIK